MSLGFFSYEIYVDIDKVKNYIFLNSELQIVRLLHLKPHLEQVIYSLTTFIAFASTIKKKKRKGLFSVLEERRFYDGKG